MNQTRPRLANPPAEVVAARDKARKAAAARDDIRRQLADAIKARDAGVAHVVDGAISVADYTDLFTAVLALEALEAAAKTHADELFEAARRAEAAAVASEERRKAEAAHELRSRAGSAEALFNEIFIGSPQHRAACERAAAEGRYPPGVPNFNWVSHHAPGIRAGNIEAGEAKWVVVDRAAFVTWVEKAAGVFLLPPNEAAAAVLHISRRAGSVPRAGVDWL